MLSFVLGLLNPLSRLLKSIDNATDNETERQRIKAEVIEGYIKAAAETRQIAMQSRAFWIVWSLFAAPLGIWWSLVLIDTSFTAFSWGIPDLPPSVRPWADIIFGSIFGSGATVGAAQAIAGALRRK